MSPSEIRAIADQYQKRFGNLAEIAHPSIMYEDQFGELLQKAIDTGVKLTRADVDQAFPGIPWEE